MKISSTLIALAGIASLNADGAMAKCFGSGDAWPSKVEARSWVEFACKGKGGMFTGNFAPGQTKSMCPTSKYGGKKVAFQVQNLNTKTGFDLGDGDCYNRLNSEITKCQYGGETNAAGWRFK
ncbi:hypothetical protein MBLNU230_g5243t1 [Neophaeotheca triangularis]